MFPKRTTNELSSTTAPAYCLKVLSKPQNRRENKKNLAVIPCERDGDESSRRPNQLEFTGHCNGKEGATQREGSGDQQKVSSRLGQVMICT